MSVDRVIEILMSRDNITRSEAIDRIQDCREAMYDAMENYNTSEAIEDILQAELSLEPDYIIDIL